VTSTKSNDVQYGIYIAVLPLGTTSGKDYCSEMFAFKVRFFLLLSSSIASDVNLLHLLKHYCPKSLDCQLENTNSSNLTETKWDECCGKCSCDKQCGQTQSCCFAEDNARYSKTHGKECIDPFIGDRLHFEQIGGHGVVMVTQCPERNEECMNINGTVNVSPVESTSSEVFINPECARCNNVSSFVRWNARIVSTGKHIYSFRYIEKPTIITETIIYEPPTKFTYPECYGSFVTVDIAKCPNELYKLACTSTVLPVFTRLGTYQNVFCYFCVAPYLQKCSIFSRTIPGTFSLILNNKLDTTTIAAYFSREHMLINRETCQKGYMPHPSRVRS